MACKRAWWLLTITGLLLFVMTSSKGAIGDEFEERLVSVGLKVFPAIIAADESMEERSADTPLFITIVYHDNRAYAETLARRLEKISPIKGRHLRIRVLSVEQLLQQESSPDALFLSQRLDQPLEQVLDYARRHNVISFSPFRGDVERGVLAGIAVTDRILPYINLRTLSSLKLELKPFFLKVAEIYEP